MPIRYLSYVLNCWFEFVYKHDVFFLRGFAELFS
jgi:hypothetical protein